MGNAASVVAMNEFLSLDEIMASKDLDYVDVEVPEWSKPGGPVGKVRLRVMTANQAADFSDLMKDTKQQKHAMSRLVAMCAIKPEGEKPAAECALLFTDQQVANLRNKSLKVLMRLQKEALKLNGLDDEKKAEADAKND